MTDKPLREVWKEGFDAGEKKATERIVRIIKKECVNCLFISKRKRLLKEIESKK